MTLTIKRESPKHSLILGDNKWLATVNTDVVPAEIVQKAIEEYLDGAGANRGNDEA